METRISGAHFTKWKNKYYILFYKLTAEGYTRKKACATLGLSFRTFRKWEKKDKTLRWAIKEGRKPRAEGEMENVMEYVYGRLPEEQKELYNEICQIEKEKNGYERVRKLLENNGDDVKKRLFLYALVQGDFIKTKAMKKICVSNAMLQRWMKDPDFVDLMDNMEEAMKDFYQDHFHRAIKDGDTQAMIHAMKTKCRDRGFGEKMEVQHTGNINHAMTLQIDISKLSVKAQKEVYNQLEEQEKEAERLEEVKLGGGQQLQIPHKNGKKK